MLQLANQTQVWRTGNLLGEVIVMYIADENLRSIVYGFVSDDYESEFSLLRGHYLDDSSEYDDACAWLHGKTDGQVND